MLAYIKYIRKHHKDGELLRKNQGGETDLERGRLPSGQATGERWKPRPASKKSSMVVRKV
mgnify:CR=1 FL=1